MQNPGVASGDLARTIVHGLNEGNCFEMTRIILVSAGQTQWRVEGRLAGDTDLPLTELGHRQAVADSNAISHLKPTLVRCGPEHATKQTATVIAHELGIKIKTIKELREMDLGHWEGLAIADFKDRFGKVFRQWRADPTSVEPPDGESLSDAADRLTEGIRRIVKNHGDETIIAVLGQYAWAIIRCKLADGNYDQFWDYVDGDARWCEVVQVTETKEKRRSRPAG